MRMFHARIVTEIANDSDKRAKALVSGEAATALRAKKGEVTFSRGFGSQPAVLIVVLPDEEDPKTYFPELEFENVTKPEPKAKEKKGDK